MGTEVAQDPLYARDCFDEEAQSVKDAVEMYCPFNRTSGDFAWVDEYLQNTDRCKLPYFLILFQLAPLLLSRTRKSMPNVSQSRAGDKICCPEENAQTAGNANQVSATSENRFASED